MKREMDDPYGIKVELWFMAKDAGLNLDDLDPERLKREIGDDSTKAWFERDMLRTGVTVEDLKAVARGVFDDDYYAPCDDWQGLNDHSTYLPAVETVDVSMAEGYDPGEDVDLEGEEDEDEDEDDSLPMSLDKLRKIYPKFFPPISEDDDRRGGCKRNNDGEIIKKDDDDLLLLAATSTGGGGGGDDKQMMKDEEDVLLCYNKRLRPLPLPKQFGFKD